MWAPQPQIRGWDQGPVIGGVPAHPLQGAGDAQLLHLAGEVRGQGLADGIPVGVEQRQLRLDAVLLPDQLNPVLYPFKGPGHLPGRLIGDQPLQGGQEAPLTLEDSGDDGADAENHDDALDEVVDGGGHVAPGDDVDTGENRHHHHAHAVVDVKGHAEQAGEPVVEAGGVGDEEDEDNH